MLKIYALFLHFDKKACKFFAGSNIVQIFVLIMSRT